MIEYTAPSGLNSSFAIVTQGSASLHPGLRVLRPFGTNVQGENVSVPMVRDLAHGDDPHRPRCSSSIDREKAAFARRGGFVTLAAPTSKMKEEAVGLGFYKAEVYGPEYPKLQILTIEGLMNGTERPRYPDLSLGRSTFKRAQVEDVSGEQGKLL